MKKLLIIFCLLTALSLPSLAGDNPGGSIIGDNPGGSIVTTIMSVFASLIP